jgi:hypothetical protein
LEHEFDTVAGIGTPLIQLEVTNCDLHKGLYMVNTQLIKSETIQKKIYTIRGIQLMLDTDLAYLYGVETKVLNQAVKRNSMRFPADFMFRVTKEEYDSLRSQIVTLENARGKHRKYLPYAFTEQGVAMLSAVLKSDTAINVSIQIMNAFVVMRRFLVANARVFERLDSLELKQLATDKKIEQVLDAIESKRIPPKQGIFFEGQVFDAFQLVSDLVRAAKSSIVLIDNYIDDSVLTLFSKRRKDVKLFILTKSVSKQLQLDVDKFNAQYPPASIRPFNKAHDRFLIIDDKDVYHFGASLKDAGKKWFAFSKMDKASFSLIENLEKVAADE